jgi:glycosyltransferase involved in cell wall biosynthesis
MAEPCKPDKFAADRAAIRAVCEAASAERRYATASCRPPLSTRRLAAPLAPVVAPARLSMNVLYITYDGLTDFIGQAQVLPYLVGSARAGHRITVISFEKPERFARIGHQVKAVTETEGITWRPQTFRTSPPILAKLVDQQVMLRAAAAELKRGRFEALHCRSYPPAVAGLKLKRRFGTPLIFDMRGFWPDSRREGGRWRDESPLGRFLYRRWKRHETDLMAGSDHIVSLTKAAKAEMESWPSYRGAPISIIPCCTDFETFRPSGPEQRRAARAELGIAPDAPLLVYLGSLGTIYLLGEQLRLFDRFRIRHPGARILFVGRNSADDIRREATRLGIALTDDEFRLVEAERARVPYWLSAGDAGLCFYIPTMSSLHVSPTKLGEYLACGLPAFCNRGVGDVVPILARTEGGHVLPDFSPESLDAAIAAYDGMQKVDGASIRERARPFLDLSAAAAAYASIYADLGRAYEVPF